MFLPLVEGSMIHQFDPTYQRWESGFGSSSIWRYIERDKKQCLPRYVINATHVAERNEFTHRARLAFRTVARNTHTRTMLATYIPPLGCGNSVSTLRVSGGSIDRTLFAVAVFNSFCFDFVVRLRNAGLNQNWFIIKECPFPKVDSSDPRYSLVVDCAARVNFIHRRFALEWLVLKKKMGYGPTVQWKYRWAVATSKWVRSRICCDALVADLFGVTPSQYRWIVREDLSESKGFWRVDKELPYEARLTGLSARAFQTLKEGKWSAETAAELSNDEFFEILGIPELTNAEAAKAKGLSGPLILKRKGCHSWHPENFPEDDPRHGWTWDDCRKDAIALLGSEEAVEEYIAKATGDGSEGEEDEEPFQLISDPAEKKNPQRRLF